MRTGLKCDGTWNKNNEKCNKTSGGIIVISESLHDMGNIPGRKGGEILIWGKITGAT